MDALPKKSLGQHWLNDPATLQAMADSADTQQGDIVLEIGPGQGSLTAVLLERGAEVTALEFDEELIPDLQRKFRDRDRLIIQQGDIRHYDFGSLPDVYKIAANIPYYLTANLMRLLTDPPTHKPAKAALLMQKEVAERIAAGPGGMAFLSVAAQFYYQTEKGREVPAKLFEPPPKVDSQILILTKRGQPLFPDVDVKTFFRLVKAGFAQRRKTLLNSLSSGLRLSRETAEQTLRNAGIDPGRRAQTLSLEEWHALYQKLDVLSI
jgi:16S rRNA (adenine1518-N6/adenine1519-N6)-dimethyltransferase